MSKSPILGALLFSMCAAVAQQQTYTYSYAGSPIAVLPDETDVITVLRVAVPHALTITKVTARVQVQFDGVGDLNIFLYSPYETRVKLLERNCGSLRNVDAVFDDAAPSRYSDACPAPNGGAYRGNEPLGNYTGQNSLGVFRLAVENNGSNKWGWITGFSITVTGTQAVQPTISRETIVSEASRRSTGSVAPGERVSIYGAGLGPNEGVAAASGNLPTSLAGTTVLLDGVAVPIIYASFFRVDVQVPYTHAPGGPTNFQVMREGFTSSPAQMDVVYTRPGLYTLQPAGLGQVKAINQNGTLNSQLTPADKGSVISLYVSGLGAVDPQIAAGVPPPANPLSVALFPVSVAIGGFPCQVVYAGLAPGIVGVYQVNVRIDPAVPSGAREIVLYSYGSASQDGVFVHIR